MAPDSEESPKNYENVLRSTLMKRTGKAFKRNMDSAPTPSPSTLNHDQVANQIFDSILSRQSPDKAPAEAKAERSENYGNILDDILGVEEADVEQTLMESASPPRPRPTGKAYDRLRKKAGKQRPLADTDFQGPNTQDYTKALDDILGLDGISPDFESSDALTRTLYHQHLDEILWPSLAELSEDESQEELPPVNEEKIRAVAADYLKALIVPEPYSLIGIQRRVLDETYSLYWIREHMNALSLELQTFETEFTIWVFMNNLELIKPLLTQEFVERNRLIIEHLLPRKKGEKLFTRTLGDKNQGLVFDRMINNKFEDVRRILKHYQRNFSSDDSFHLFNFFRIKLPEFLLEHRDSLMQVLTYRSADAAANPFVGSLMSTLFFSEAFEARFQEVVSNEKVYKKAFQNFLRERADKIGEPEDYFYQQLLVSIDLYHEKAQLFLSHEREKLQQAIELGDMLLHYVPDAALETECFDNNLIALVEDRVQSQYHVENQALQSLSSEIQQLARQAESDAQLRIRQLNSMYERHYKEMTETYHKRRDTLSKLTAEEAAGGGKPKRKQFLQRKLRSCQQYLKRRQKRQRSPVEITYRHYTPEKLAQQAKELVEAQSWDNDFERKIMDNAIEKSNIVLKNLNESKSSVQFNLKVLFNGEPEQDVFLLAFWALSQQLEQHQALSDHPSYQHVQRVLSPYIEGLRLPQKPDLPEMTLTEQIGYITAYLGHVSHIKLLLNNQFRQVIFDFQRLFELVHTLHVWLAFVNSAQSSYEQHYQQALMPAWSCLLGHCLLVGKGKYHFVANPLAYNDYSWQAPLAGFGTLRLDAPEEDTGFQRVKSDDDGPFKFKLSGRKSRLKLQAPQELPEKEPEEESSTLRLEAPADAPDDTGPPALPPGRKKRGTLPEPGAEGARRLPVAPGKFEMYSSPTRRRPPVMNNNFSVEEDDFYKIMSNTHVSQSDHSQSPPPPGPPEDDSDFGLLSFDDEDLEASLDLDQTLASKTPAKAESKAPPQPPGPASPGSKKERKRWLEITPVPQKGEDIQAKLDAALDNGEPSNLEHEQNQSRVEAILQRNALDPDMEVNGNTSISHTIGQKRRGGTPSNTIRRRFRFDED